MRTLRIESDYKESWLTTGLTAQPWPKARFTTTSGNFQQQIFGGPVTMHNDWNALRISLNTDLIFPKKSQSWVCIISCCLQVSGYLAKSSWSSIRVLKGLDPIQNSQSEGLQLLKSIPWLLFPAPLRCPSTVRAASINYLSAQCSHCRWDHWLPKMPMLSPRIRHDAQITFPLKVFSYQNMKDGSFKWNLRTKAGDRGGDGLSTMLICSKMLAFKSILSKFHWVLCYKLGVDFINNVIKSQWGKHEMCIIVGYTVNN